MKTMIIMATEKIMGLATSVHEEMIIAALLRDRFFSSDRFRMIFSTMTIDASPSIPIATAIPPRDIRFAEIPAMPINITATKAHTGNANET